jgi:hypothetical protein
MARKKVTCPASDWQHSWGYGTNKIGRVRIVDAEQNIYSWSGHSQGRHGQVWNRGAKVVFRVVNLEQRTAEVISSKGITLSFGDDMWKAVETLTNQ